MKANELRIGNLFEEGEVVAIPNENGEEVVLKTIALTFDALTPIPLTEEWLKKFGFKIEYGINRLEGVGFSFTIDLSTGLANISPGGMLDETYGIDIPSKYVHQLQNLYFALTGEELEITEKL